MPLEPALADRLDNEARTQQPAGIGSDNDLTCPCFGLEPSLTRVVSPRMRLRQCGYSRNRMRPSG